MTDLTGAEALLRDGKVDQAVGVLQQILEADPDNADALYLSATIAWQLRYHDQAIELYEQALEVRPDFAEAHLMLGNALGASGRDDEALLHWRRAIALKPGNARAHGNIAYVLGARGENAAAAESAQRAITLDPGLGRAHMILGVALHAMGRLGAAEPPLREALRLAQADKDCLKALGYLLIDTGRAAEAHGLLAQVLALDPTETRALRLVAQAYLVENDFAAAERALLQATADLPGWAEGWSVLATVQGILGRFDDAAASLQRALSLDPDNAEALRSLAAIRRGAAGRAEVDRLNRLLASPSLQPRSRAEAGFALGKLLDDNDRFDEAFAAFAAANAQIHAAVATAEDRYVPVRQRAVVDALTGRFPPAVLRGIGDGAEQSELPVFIVGMPRSGTSLVEQIVASHSRVFGAGELPDIQAMTRALQADEAGVAAARALGAGHLQRLREIGGQAVRVTDKAPDNVFHLGTIAAVYPRARVIAVRRDPRDTCLSCYFQKFSDHRVMFAYDLAECGHWAVAVDRMLAHWRAAPPVPMLELHYEDLVADLEGQSRRLIAFLGLDWEASCLDFHRTARTVATASAWQVRQPLYSRSVGRWRNYERHLGPLLEVLRRRWPEM